MFALAASGLFGQSSDGGTGSAIAGALLGGFAGATVGSMGSMLPCTETPYGTWCVGVSSAIGGVLGATSGAIVGHEDRALLEDRATSAVIGFAAGAGVGLAGSPFAQRFGALDVLAVGLVGAAVGTQPRNALIGASAGAVVGAGLWFAVPGIELPDAVATMLAGVAIGVWSGWIRDASAAGPDGAPAAPLTLGFSFSR